MYTFKMHQQDMETQEKKNGIVSIKTEPKVNQDFKKSELEEIFKISPLIKISPLVKMSPLILHVTGKSAGEIVCYTVFCMCVQAFQCKVGRQKTRGKRNKQGEDCG